MSGLNRGYYTIWTNLSVLAYAMEMYMIILLYTLILLGECS